MISCQVYNFIAQRDNMLNVEVARDSRAVAVASKRDSSAMKTLAIVTMAFLPGTFIAVRTYLSSTYSLKHATAPCHVRL
jgi:hypothetical protein